MNSVTSSFENQTRSHRGKFGLWVLLADSLVAPISAPAQTKENTSFRMLGAYDEKQSCSDYIFG